MPGLAKYIFRISLVLILFLQLKGGVSQFFHNEEFSVTDSLEAILPGAEGDIRIGILCKLSKAYRVFQPERSLELALEAYRSSRDSENPQLKLQATYMLGLAYHHNGDYPNAIGYSIDARPMAIDLKDTLTLYGITECIVLSYLYSHNYDLAIENTLAGYAFLGTMTDSSQLFEKSIRIGWVYMMTGNDSTAIPYFRNAATIATVSGQVPASNMVLNYNHLTGRYLNVGNYDSARYFLKLAEEMSLQQQVDFNNYILSNWGDYYYFTQKPDTAEMYYQKALQHSRLSGDIAGQAGGLWDLGKIYRAEGEMKQAIACFEEMVEKGTWIREHRSLYLDPERTFSYWYSPEQSVPHYMERAGLRFLMNGHLNLYEIFKSGSDQKQALLHLEAFREAEARNRELDRMMEVTEISTRYESERKEQQIQLLTSEKQLSDIRLEQSKYILFTLAGFILLLLIVAILLIRQSRMKALQEKANLEQRLFRAQMNPHFLFNTLGSIQGFILEHDTDRSNLYLTRFSRLMRNILDNTTQEAIPLEDEISTIENYLELQKIRYTDKFDFTITVDERIDPEGFFIPPMLAQPFIENSIEHGIKHLPGKGLISIRFSLIDSTFDGSGTEASVEPDPDSLVLLEIEDNGVGREESRKMEHNRFKNHRPMATSITRERMNVLGRKAPRKIRKRIRLQIQDLFTDDKKPAGTKVQLWVPLSRP